MDRYQRVERPRPESAINENEVRITTQGMIRNYVNYAISLLQERRIKEIVLKAMGQAISKSVAVAEILKKRIPGLHQDTAISSVSITDVWEPIEEGLVPLEMTRHVSMISISLSTKELNKTSPGYQAPEFDDQQQQPPRQQQRYQQPQQSRQPRQGQYDYYDIHMGKGGGEGGEEGGEGEVGAGEAMVDTATTKVDMATTKEDTATTKEDIATTKADTGTTKVDTGTTKVDTVTTKVDMVTTKVDTATATATKAKVGDIETIKGGMADMATAAKGGMVAVVAVMAPIKIMVAIMRIGAGEVVCEAEEIGDIEGDMKEEQAAAGLVEEVTTVEGDG